MFNNIILLMHEMTDRPFIIKKTSGGFIMTEREAATKLDAVCFCYGQSNERKARLSKAIMDYVQAVQQNGLDNHPGYFSLSHIRNTFGLEFNDQPAVRYNKIATFRV